MADIKITFAEVEAKTQQIRNHNKRLDETLAEIKKVINALEADWTSDASDEIRAKITGMQPKFDSYREVIESYAKFLDGVVEKWKTTDEARAQSARADFV